MNNELQHRTHRGPGIKDWRLIIRNLPFTATKDDIKQWFGTFGHILEIVLPKCKNKLFPNSSAGFCFVQFSSRNDAKKAMNALNFAELNGRKVAVDWALDKDAYITKKHESAKKANADSNETVVKAEPTDEAKNEQEDEDDEERGAKSENAETEDENEDNGEGRGEDNCVEHDGSEKIRKGMANLKTKHQKENKRGDLEDSAVAEGRVVFLRNVPFSTGEDELKKVAEELGEVKLAILCRNKDTGDPMGTAFVHFREKDSADAFLDRLSKENGVLLEGRRIFGHRAVQRKEANAFGASDKKLVKDKRNLYLMRASLVRPGTVQAKEMSEEDAKLRERLMEVAKNKLKNLVMFVSPTRLVIHNIPFSWTNAQLKSVCLDAAADCPSSSISECWIMCQRKGQDEKGRAILGKSCGFGFVSFTEHALALECLKKLNNNPKTFTNERRPIVEFSIENLNALRVKEQRQQNKAKSEKKEEEKGQQRKKQRENVEAVEKTKRGLMAGGKKWLPRKFGVKIRHKAQQQKKTRQLRAKNKNGNGVKVKRKRKASGAIGGEKPAKRNRMRMSQ